MGAENVKTLQGRQFPKALGDVVESIAGAILIDSKLNVEQVWKIFEPLLSPIVTPDSLELPPFRELTELCDRLGYFFKEHCINDEGFVLVELKLQLKDVLLIGEGVSKTRKAAKGLAAHYLLCELENRGVAKRGKRELLDVARLIDLNPILKRKNSSVELKSHKKQKTSRLQLENTLGSDAVTPVITAINTDKGGPRTALYDLCKKLQWPMPSFEVIEQKPRSPIEFIEGSNKRQSFNSFVSKIALHIPDCGVIEAMGEARADKKRSHDSAALHLLNKLEELGKLIIGCS